MTAEHEMQNVGMKIRENSTTVTFTLLVAVTLPNTRTYILAIVNKELTCSVTLVQNSIR